MQVREVTTVIMALRWVWMLWEFGKDMGMMVQVRYQ